MGILKILIHRTSLLKLVLLSAFTLWAPLLWSQVPTPANISTFEVEADTTPEAIIIDPDVLVTMRDGVNIAVDIYRPAQPGAYPTLYAAAPYPHNDNAIAPNNAFTGPVEWFVNQGFNYVLASSRGTGLSQGSYDLLSREEQQDHYELVEWIAQQEWSNGKVAGVGASYYATSQWQMAIQNPPHLECIAPFNGVVQPYQDWAFPGGLASESFSQTWYKQAIRQANAFPNSGPARIVEYDLDLQLLLHPYYDDYWRIRTSLENIDEISIPTFILRDWDTNEPGLEGTLKAIEALNSSHKILLLNAENLYQDESFLEQELLPFYSWCLNNIEQSSYVDQADIRYFVSGLNQSKQETTWPPANTQLIPLFLNRQSTSNADSSTLNFTAHSNTSSSQYGTDTENTAITFTSDILEQDIEIAGSLLVELYASSSATDTAFHLELSEQVIRRQISPTIEIPDFLQSNITTSALEANILTANALVPVSSGSLKASARGALPEPTLLTPNAVTRFDISLHSTAHQFKRGNRIVLKIQKALDGSLANKPSQENIFHNSRYPSRLWLPTAQSIQTDRPAREPIEVKPENEDIATPGTQTRPEFDFLNIENLEKDEDLSPIIFIR